MRPALAPSIADGFSEKPFWARVSPGWQPLGGNIARDGFSLEWHEFHCAEDINWAESFHPGCLEVCFNLTGHGQVSLGRETSLFGPGQVGFYFPGVQSLRASRHGDDHHRFLTIECAPSFLESYFPCTSAKLSPQIKCLLEGDRITSHLSSTRFLTSRQQELVLSVRQPPVPEAARPVWCRAKVLELLAEFLFDSEGAISCERPCHLARERSQQVIAILSEDLVEPPSLEEIGRRVGCSSYHLSRTFSKEMGMTIPRYLRRLRMERAAELLRSGRYNVTEAAMAVGYSSLSHFSQAFCQTMGCCPNLYPQAKALIPQDDERPSGIRRLP